MSSRIFIIDRPDIPEAFLSSAFEVCENDEYHGFFILGIAGPFGYNDLDTKEPMMKTDGIFQDCVSNNRGHPRGSNGAF